MPDTAGRIGNEYRMTSRIYLLSEGLTVARCLPAPARLGCCCCCYRRRKLPISGESLPHSIAIKRFLSLWTTACFSQTLPGYTQRGLT